MSGADEGHLMAGDGLKGRWRGVATIATAAWRVDRRLTIKTIGLDLAAGQAAPLLAIGVGLLVDGHRLAALLILTASATAIVAAGRAALLNRIRLEERVSHAIAADVVGIVTGIATVDHHENPKHLKRVERLLNYNWLIGMAVPAVVLLAEAVIRFVATIVVLSWIDARLAFLPLAIAPVLVAGAWAERLRLVSLDARAEFDRRAMDQFWLVSGRWSGRDPDAEVRVFGLGEPLVDIHRTAWRKVVRDEIIHRTKGGVAQAITRAGFAAAFGLGLVLLARRVADGHATPGELVTALGLAGQVLQQASTVAANGNWLNWALTSVRDYVWLLDHRDALAGPAAGQAVPPVRLDEGIRLEDVTFAYGQGDDAKTVLENIDLHLQPGEVVAIVGSNGAGKTTLTKLLLGLHRPTSGRITVDGVDLNNIDPSSWRTRATAALQEHMRPEFQAGTAIGIGDLDHLDDASAITRASVRAGADSVVNGLPSGDATQLGTDWPDGIELSGGEWQRIAVARSAMRTGELGPLLLVLDEPAAALDPEAEHRLFELYTETADGRAERGAVTVLVSHRLSTVRDADRIVVLEDGRIVEVGHHDELMAAGGRYAHLFELQARSYR